MDDGDGCTTVHITVHLKMMKMASFVMFISPHLENGKYKEDTLAALCRR